MLAAALALPSAPASAATGGCPGAEVRPSPANAAVVQAATLCLIDAERAAHQLHPLRSNRALQAVAVRQLACMMRSNRFAEDCPSGVTPLARIAATRYASHAAALSVGQNLGWATGADRTPAAMVAAWMRSRPHCENILTATFTDAGVAVTPFVPPTLGIDEPAVMYALELAARLPEGRPSHACPDHAARGRPRRPPPRLALPRPISQGPASPSSRD
jgi:uncharacterized protein YkwD